MPLSHRVTRPAEGGAAAGGGGSSLPPLPLTPQVSSHEDSGFRVVSKQLAPGVAALSGWGSRVLTGQGGWCQLVANPQLLPALPPFSCARPPPEGSGWQCGALGVLLGCPVPIIPWTAAASPRGSSCLSCPTAFFPRSPQGKESSRAQGTEAFCTQ